MRCLFYQSEKRSNGLIIIGYIKQVEGSETCGKQRRSGKLHSKASNFGCVAYRHINHIVAWVRFCCGQRAEPLTIVTHDIITITLSLICA